MRRSATVRLSWACRVAGVAALAWSICVLAPTVAEAQAAPQATPGQPQLEIRKNLLPDSEMAPADETMAAPVPPRDLGTGQVRVGLILPLSGPHARLGRDMLDAALMAVADMADDRLVLLPRDDEGTAEGAQRAAASVLEDGAALILGPLFSTSVEPVASQARPLNVSVLSFSTDRNVAGNGVFVMGFLPGQQVDRVVSYAAEKGSKRLAVLAPATPYGRIVVDALREATIKRNLMLTQQRFYNPGEDPAPTVRGLAQGMGGPGGFDALLIAEGGERLQQVAALLPYYDIDPAQVRFLGTGLWEGAINIRTETALIGAWFAAPSAAGRGAFEKRFKDLYGRDPARLATMAYDSAALAAVLGRTAGGADFSVARIEAPNGFSGLDGIFRFRSDGLVERALAVFEVQRGGMQPVSPAAEMFPLPD
ncbi:MAG: penicillin-binding protein activator [Alphaproteobacteria bacterium]